MPNTEALVLQMSADITRMTKALNQVRGQTNRQLKAVEDRFDKVNGHIRRSGDTMAADFRRSIAALGVGLAVRQLTSLSDSWTNLRNQARQFGDVLGPVEASTDRLLKVANDAGVQIDALGQTFAASARAARTLGASADQVFAFNEAVAKGAGISNTGPQALEGSLRQLGQAIASPTVQLGEFNSVIEGTPRLAQAFADGIEEAGGSVAKLRQLISSGQISGGELFQGLIGQLGKLRTEFAATEKTVSQSVARLGNAAIRYVGEANRATGASQALSGAIDLVADNFGLLADAAIVAAAVLGTTLAAGALIRLGRGLTDVIGKARNARTAMEGLGRLGAFFGSGTGASILAIGAALGTMAFEAFAAKDPVEDLRQTMQSLGETQTEIESDTQRLTAAQEALTRAIEEQSQAAQANARVEIEAIRAKISANRDLALGFELDIRNKLQAVQKALSDTELTYARDIKNIVGLPEHLKNPQGGDRFIPASVLEEVRGFQEDPNLAGIPLNQALAHALAITTELLNKRREIGELTQDVNDLMNLRNNSVGLDVSGATVSAGLGAGLGDLKGYTTAAETLDATLGALTKARDAEAKSIVAISGEIERLIPIVDEEAGGRERLVILEQQLADATEASMLAEGERSRVVVQALLDYVNATNDLQGAFERLPSLVDVLVGDDEALIRRQLAQVATDGIDAVAAGYVKLENERDQAIRKVNAALQNARAAGIEDTRWYFESLAEIERTYAEKRLALFDDSFEVGSLPSIADTIGSLPDLAGIADAMRESWIRDGLIPSEAYQEMQRVMRDSVKNAMREGIRTGDWGDSFAMILADGLTAALDESLNRVADFLADFLFASDGLFANILNAGANFAFGGQRAAGGPVFGGKTYLVGEKGPELLTMGGSGQVLNANATQNLLQKGSAGPTVVNANLVIQGSVDAVTWPKVEQAMQQQAFRIMSAVPGAARAALIHDKKHGLNGWRKQ